jgi:prepilin-type N-terminal cleavage/methylation domain-containing protein
MIRDSGFTMIEVVASLVLFGLIALVAGMGIVSFAKGYVFTRDSTHNWPWAD